MAVTVPKLAQMVLYWRRGQRILCLKAFDLTTAGASSLQGFWYWDFEVLATLEHIEDDNLFDLSAGTTSYICQLIELLDALVENSFLANASEAERSMTMIRILFSKGSGFAARSDFLTYRLNGACNVHSVVSFLEPLSSVIGVSPEQASLANSVDDFIRLLGKALGSVVIRRTAESLSVELLRQNLDDEFLNRLSVPWIIEQEIRRSRVFWVQGRADIDASRQFYEAAKRLGITLVVLDQPGHWLQDDKGPYAHYREAFIPISVDGDEGLTQRVVDAVKSYPYKVDGIVTISDVRLPLVARACEILGLPTSPSAAYFLAGDKGATRELENDAASTKEGLVVNTADDLDAIFQKDASSLRFPLIVKPCSGWNSDCVRKVRNRDELYAAVQSASTRHANSPKSSTRVVVEPYIDGPEIDANFIILDGEVLFCDISDDFPSSGDRPDGKLDATAHNFMETLMDVPTALPTVEQKIVKEALTKSISRLGFQSGIFHCEARVRDSCAHYRRSEDGIVDLHLVKGVNTRQTPPSCYLHEVNARSPGYINCVAALLAYGVDYYAIRLLLSLGPRENQRVKVLSQPFLGGKPQYVLGVVVLPPTRAGIMASDDAVEEFLVTQPALREHVLHTQTIIKKGDLVRGPDSNELWCVGYIIVASRKGRQQCLQIVKQIREKFDYRLEDD